MSTLSWIITMSLAGGVLSVQYRPNDTWDVTATGFYSTMDTNNYGRLTAGAIYSMLLGKNEPFGATGASAPNTSSGGTALPFSTACRPPNPIAIPAR